MSKRNSFLSFRGGWGGGGAADVVSPSDRIIRAAGVNRESLRKWWAQVRAEHGKYKCYAVFLYLPTDYSAQIYLKDQAFMQELDLISGKHCLVIATSKEYIRRFGIDKEPVQPSGWFDRKVQAETGEVQWVPSEDEYKTLEWRGDQVERRKKPLGYCRMFARMFNITYDKFPCMILFESIDSPRHIVVSLQGIDSKKIAMRMHNIFIVVGNAVAAKKDPLKEVRGYLLKYKIMSKKDKAVNDVVEFAGKTMGYAMQAWINSLFK